MTAGSDLNSYMLEAAGAVRQRHLDLLRSLGVAPTTLAELGLTAPPFGVATGTLGRSGLFEPGPGPAFVVQPVREGGETIDVLAWRTLRPESWGLLRGVGWILGDDHLREAKDYRRPLHLHSTPLAWLQSGCEGAVIVDWDASEIRSLIDLDEITVDSWRLKDALTSELSAPPRLPRITRWKAARHA